MATVEIVKGKGVVRSLQIGTPQNNPLWVVIYPTSSMDQFLVDHKNNKTDQISETDKRLSPSIKDCERDSRASTSVSYQIIGPAQKRPSNWISALKHASFKKSLVEFLVNRWEDDGLADVFQQKNSLF